MLLIISGHKSTRVQNWLHSYKDLLDQWIAPEAIKPKAKYVEPATIDHRHRGTRVLWGGGAKPQSALKLTFALICDTRKWPHPSILYSNLHGIPTLLQHKLSAGWYIGPLPM